jgi:hypothetical protein
VPNSHPWSPHPEFQSNDTYPTSSEASTMPASAIYHLDEGSDKPAECSWQVVCFTLVETRAREISCERHAKRNHKTQPDHAAGLSLCHPVDAMMAGMDMVKGEAQPRKLPRFDGLHVTAR